jgi:hypothetical protein
VGIGARASKWGRSGSELGWDCLPIPRQELIEILDVVIVDAGQHVGQPFLGIDVIQFGGLDQGAIDEEAGEAFHRLSM